MLVRQRIQRKLFNTWPLLLRHQRPQEVQSLRCKCRYVWVKWLEVNTEKSCKVLLKRTTMDLGAPPSIITPSIFCNAAFRLGFSLQNNLKI